MTLELDKSSWKRTAFGDVVKNLNVTVRDPEAEGISRIIAMEHLDPGKLRIKRWGEVADGTTFTRGVRPGQTLFGKRRAYQRKAAYADFEAICSGDILVFDADRDRMLPAFLPFLVQSNGFYEHALGTSAGSLSPRTNWRDLANYEFDLPPLDEQKRIADLLWAVEAERRHSAEVVASVARAMNTDRLFMICRGLDGRGVNALPRDAYDKWTCEVPEGWSATSIGSVARVRSGATPRRSDHRYFAPDGLPWVKTLDLNESVLLETDERITDAALAETSCSVVDAGTVLVAMYGGFGQIGRTAMLGVDAATNQAVSALTELASHVDPVFLHHVLRAGRGRWRRVAASSRKDPNITKRDIENFEFPCPPLNIQKDIVAVLAHYEAAMESARTRARKAMGLQATLMSQVFGAVA